MIDDGIKVREGKVIEVFVFVCVVYVCVGGR